MTGNVSQSSYGQKKRPARGLIKILASLLNGAVLIEQTGRDIPISMATTAGLTLQSA